MSNLKEIMSVLKQKYGIVFEAKLFTEQSIAYLKELQGVNKGE